MPFFRVYNSVLHFFAGSLVVISMLEKKIMGALLEKGSECIGSPIKFIFGPELDIMGENFRNLKNNDVIMAQ